MDLLTLDADFKYLLLDVDEEDLAHRQSIIPVPESILLNNIHTSVNETSYNKKLKIDTIISETIIE